MIRFGSYANIIYVVFFAAVWGDDIINIKEWNFFKKYSLNERLVIAVLVSLFFPLPLGYIPTITAISALAIVSVYILINKETRKLVIGVPYSWCGFGVAIISLVSSLIFGNWYGIAVTLLIFCIIVFSFFARAIINYRFFNDILNIIIALSVVPAVIGAFQKLYFLHFLRSNNIKLPFDGRVYSIFLNPNYYAYIAGLFIIIIVYKLLSIEDNAEKYRKFYYYSVLVLNIIAIMLTNCRSSLIAVLAGIIILTVSHRKYIWPAILLFIYFTYYIAIEYLPDIFPRMDLLYLDNSFNERLLIWKNALIGIKESPFIGQGALGYKLLVEKYNVLNKEHAHNLLIDIVLNYGILGASLFIVYFTKSAASVKLFFNNSKGRTTYIFLISILAITIIHGITDVTVLGVQTGILFGLLISGFGIDFSKTKI